MSDSCKETVWGDGRWPRKMPCRNPATRDGYCGIHHPDAVAAREQKSKQRNAQYAARIEAKIAAKNEQSRHASAYPKLVMTLLRCINGMPHNPPQEEAITLLRELGELP